MRDPNIHHAYEDLAKLAADKAVKRQYELREKAERDFRNTVRTAREEGWQEGRQEGRQEGQQEGAQQEKLRLAKELLAEGLDEELVTKVTGLNKSELARLEGDS
ncbi:MAG: hypothetical protein GX249_11865 [Firmicutes bacterium]|nr:hypothetical protein [Bacillota bacterium]